MNNLRSVLTGGHSSYLLYKLETETIIYWDLKLLFFVSDYFEDMCAQCCCLTNLNYMFSNDVVQVQTESRRTKFANNVLHTCPPSDDCRFYFMINIVAFRAWIKCIVNISMSCSAALIRILVQRAQIETHFQTRHDHVLKAIQNGVVMVMSTVISLLRPEQHAAVEWSMTSMYTVREGVLILEFLSCDSRIRPAVQMLWAKVARCVWLQPACIDYRSETLRQSHTYIHQHQ